MLDNTTKKDRPWLLPDSRSSAITPGLYLVSTPIGNLGDMTLRGLDTLARADLVVCEDTRVSGKLLQYFGLSKKLLSYNDHNAGQQRPKIIKALKEKQVVALVSDAGTPLINDPGYKLVQDCQKEKLPVSAVPGANAPLTALQLSGLPSDQFCFLGFLPAKSAARKNVLKSWRAVPATLIAFETGARLIKSLADIAEVLPEREVAVTRELTKLHEEVRRGAAQSLLEEYEGAGAPKGEIVLVLGPPELSDVSDEAVRDKLEAALISMKTKEAAAFVAEETGRPKAEIYDMALAIKNDKK